MPSSNITGLTALAVMQPDMLMYAGISPFGATDDRKITASDLLTTITPLDNNTAALVVTNSSVPTVPQVVFTNAAGTKRMQIAMAGAATITDTFDELSMFSSVAGFNLSIGVWNAIDDGSAAEIFLYTGAAGLEHTRLRAVDNGNTNTDLFTVPKSGVLLTSNTSSGGLILDTDVAAPIIFATGGHAFTNEKGRFDAAGFTLGKASSVTGALNLANSASANLTTIQAGNAAAAVTYTWPTNVGAAGSVLTDAAGNGVLSWAAGGGGSGTVNAGTANELAYYPASAAAVSGNSALVVGSGFALNIIQPTNGDSDGLAILANNLSQHSTYGWKAITSTSNAFYIATAAAAITLNNPMQFTGAAGIVMSLDMNSGGGGSVGVNYVIAAGTDGQLFVVSGAATRPAIVARAAAAQSAAIQDWRDSGNNVLAAILNNGAFQPASLADANAANNTLYFSTDAGKLVYKDSGGTVNNLY